MVDPVMRPILVVEDDADTRELLTDALREDGFDVIASDEGRKAIELATVLRPSIVLLDMAMAGMDGRTFLDRRRAVPALASTPVVVITGSDVTGVAADAILRKPLEMREVLATVRRLRARGA
jgi:DNA-binding response OmpR family regulator